MPVTLGSGPGYAWGGDDQLVPNAPMLHGFTHCMRISRMIYNAPLRRMSMLFCITADKILGIECARYDTYISGNCVEA